MRLPWMKLFCWLVYPGDLGQEVAMSTAAKVLIHPSQFPDQVRHDLMESLRSRRVNHKFHYDSIKQTQKWLALHQVHSPSRNDLDCATVYDRSFTDAVARVTAQAVHLIGLGCGGGLKDTRLLKLLQQAGREVHYTPCDVSTAMVLVARQTALAVVPDDCCFPVVCDLSSEPDLAKVFRNGDDSVQRLFTFFGMVPNFEPGVILPKLAQLVRKRDWLLLSANLAPGANYEQGVQRIVPQYDNPLTREWLVTFLTDLGVERSDGELRFSIGSDDQELGLKRVVSEFFFSRPVRIQIDSDNFPFAPGESIRLFFSYRYTPELLKRVVAEHGFSVSAEWIAGSEEEGVFLLSHG